MYVNGERITSGDMTNHKQKDWRSPEESSQPNMARAWCRGPVFVTLARDGVTRASVSWLSAHSHALTAPCRGLLLGGTEVTSVAVDARREDAAAERFGPTKSHHAWPRRGYPAAALTYTST